MSLRVAAILSLCVACGSHEASATAAAPPTATPDRPPVPETPTELAVGWGELPVDPPDDARESNRAALRLHERGEYGESERAFGVIASEHPTFLLARFNHACALSRLGRHDEAARELEALLALDHPTFAPRIAADPDLETLRASPSWPAVDRTARRAREAFLRALEAGAPVVHETRAETPLPDGESDRRRTAQAGVWLETERRFVPMGPRTSSSTRELGEIPIAATVLDAARRTVIVASGNGIGAEGGDFIDGLQIAGYAAADGTELGRFPPPRPPELRELARIHATERGIAADWLDATGEARIAAVRGEGRFDADAIPRLDLSQDGVGVVLVAPRPDATLRGRRLRVHDGDRDVTIEIDRVHRDRHLGRVELTVLPGPGRTLWALTGEVVLPEGYEPARYGVAALSLVDLDAATARLVLEGRGVAAMIEHHGALYVQMGDRLHRIAPGGDPAALPAGLVLIASAPTEVSEEEITSWRETP